MTVASTTTSVTYNCNGVLTEFSVTFPFMESSDLWVYLININNGNAFLLTETTHYTVTGGDGSTGLVVLVSAPDSKFQVKIERNTDFLQSTDLENQATYFLDRVETALDKLAMTAQDLDRRVDDIDADNSIDENVVRFFGLQVARDDINSGKTLLDAIPGYKYRIVSGDIVAIGASAAGATTIDILGTQSAASVKLLAIPYGSLTRSTSVRYGSTSSAPLADGAAFNTCDVNTEITIGKTGGSLTGSTYILVNLTYVVEKA